MSREFAIDGTGNIIRPGDVVEVRKVLLTEEDNGPAVVLELVDEYFTEIRFADGAEREVFTTAVRRADDPAGYWIC